jgi:hypothetical protein
VRLVEHKDRVLIEEKRLKPLPSMGQQAPSAKECAELFRPAIAGDFVAEFAEPRSIASGQDDGPFVNRLTPAIHDVTPFAFCSGFSNFYSS